MSAARISFRIVVVILALMLALLASLIWISYSPRANQLLLQEIANRVPALDINNVQGSLAGGLGFDLRYQDQMTDVQVETAALHIRPGCLWQLAVCLRSLTIESLTVTLLHREPAAADDKPVQLPSVSIPVPVNLNQLNIQQLSIRQQDATLYQAQAITLAAEAIHNRISLHGFQAQDDLCRWQGESSIRLTRRYPLRLTLQCDTAHYPFTRITAKASGDLDALSVRATTRGELSSKLNLQLALLADKLPFQARLSLLSPFTYPLEQDAITLNSAHIDAEGTLDKVTAKLQAKLSSPLFPSPLQSSADLAATMQQLDVKSLRLQLPQGDVATQGTVLFSPTLSWQAESRVDSVAFAQFTDQLQGQASGSILHQGQLTDHTLQVDIDLDQLTGSLFETPWQLDGNLNLKGDEISLNNIDIQQDRNRAQANGTLSLAGDSNLQVKLELDALAQILPQLQGSLHANLKLKGALQIPTIQGTLTARQIQYNDLTLGRAWADIDWAPLSERANRLHLQVQALQLADQLILEGDLKLRGHAQQHKAYLQVQEQQGNRLALNCNGQLAVNPSQIQFDQWHANCTQSTFDVAYLDPPQTWTLQQSFEVDISQQAGIRVTPFCYRLEGSALCLQEAFSISSGHSSPIKLQGNRLYLAWLKPWLPQDMGLDGQVDLSADIAITPELAVTATLNSDDTRLTLFDNQSHSVPLRLTHTQVSASMVGDRADINWLIKSDAGNSEGNLTMDNRQLKGNAALTEFIIEPFSRWLLEEEGDHIKGVVAGDFRIGGNLDSPSVEGQATLEQGEIHTIMLPLPIENIRITLTTEQRIARLSGQFTANNKPGQLQGIFNWQQPQWWSKVSFRSDTLAYQPTDDILIYVKPDISFNLTPHSLNINGDIQVPKARIALKSLPEQAVSVSSDAVIVDADNSTQNELDISTRLNLTLGDDVHFKGYGLETNLTGQMSIHQQQSDLLRAKGIIRLEDGTYQAYGQSLSISDGDLIFIDELDNPQLRLSATRDNINDNVVVGIRVTGRAKNPEIAIYSIPEMPQQEKFHYLLTGRAPNTDPNQDSSSVAAEAALSMALESRSGFTRKAGEKLGIQDLTLSTGSTENRSEVGLSGYITSDLMIRYGVGMFESVNTLTLKYRIHKNLYAEVISGKSNAFDILWSFDRD